MSTAALWNSYVFVQARVLKQEALSSHLAAMPMPAATVFDLVDGFEKVSPRFAPFGVAEVNGMLRLAAFLMQLAIVKVDIGPIAAVLPLDKSK